jgi:hypothetical protein
MLSDKKGLPQHDSSESVSGSRFFIQPVTGCDTTATLNGAAVLYRCPAIVLLESTVCRPPPAPYRHARHTAGADEQQRDPQGDVGVVAGFGGAGRIVARRAYIQSDRLARAVRKFRRKPMGSGCRRPQIALLQRNDGTAGGGVP